jgi:hypothetical protein
MKIASLVAKYLLALMFLVFGLNGFLHFIPMGPMPTGPASQFFRAIMESGYSGLIYGAQVLGAILLLTPYTALGLTVMAPVIVNILVFHITMMPATVAPGILALILWLLVFYPIRAAFQGILAKS